MDIKKISVVIPAYNEENTIEKLLERVFSPRQEAVRMNSDLEVIVVDDASTDSTPDIVKHVSNRYPGKITYIRQEKNQGKGAALRRGFAAVSGDVVIIQDADLEYDPSDYAKLLKPIRDDNADVVYGSRFRGEYQRVLYFWHYVGNALVTLVSNMATNLNLSDVYVCYKAFRKEVVQEILPRLVSDGFAIEAELTARIAHNKKWRVYEVPISYFGRTYEEGKKIRPWDGVRALAAIIYFNFLSR